ncbi:hypothetical protein ABZ845_00495 [Streptomyces sp. NPDC047022]|uniref:hypothetical protein n=1 Tax=Streptomyces sp. NPDC047022 TaxID=3155737 RepID=UPI0033F7EE1F
MPDSHSGWLGGRLTMTALFRPKKVAKAVFHPAWIPEAADPSVEKLKRARVICGAIAALGVYTFVRGGFSLAEMLQNTLTASGVLLLVTPLMVAAMLRVWRRTGTVSQLRAPLMNSLKLLLLFIGTVLVWVAGVAAVVMVQWTHSSSWYLLPLTALLMWLTRFAWCGTLQVSGNFFGTAAMHRCLPPLLATVTTWLMAIPDLVTGDLHGLSLAMGIVFILGAPVTVTGIAVIEMNRLKRRYGIRLRAHPATLPTMPAPPPGFPPGYGFLPAPGLGYGFPPYQGNPYGNPFAPPYGNTYLPPPPPYGNTYPSPPPPPPYGNTYPPPPNHPRYPYGPGPYSG